MVKPILDPLGEVVDLDRSGIPRDRWGHAMLYTEAGEGPVAYTGASSLGDVLASDYGLNTWDRRMIAKGVGMDRELAALAGSSTYSTGFGDRDLGKNREAGRLLDEVIERARDVAKAHQKRDWGSAVHAFTEQDDPLGQPPEEMQADIDAVREVLAQHRITPIARELFVACDELMSAGSFDMLATAPWRPLPFVVDLKTGVFHPEAVMVQLSPYARGRIYWVDDEGRHHWTTFAERFGMEVDQTFGMTLHAPAMKGEAHLYPSDLVAGYEAAKLAVAVRAHDKAFGRKSAHPAPSSAEEAMRPVIIAMIDALQQPTKAQLRDLAAEYKDVWTSDLSAHGWQALKMRGSAAA